MVHTVSVSEAALADSIAKLLVEDVASVSAEANWWHPRVRIVETWLREDANRAGMPDDGTEEMIRQSVQRGDIYPAAQLKCWQHILLELRDLACLDAALLARDSAGVDDARAGGAGGASPSRGKLRPGKELIILSDDANQDAGLPHDSRDASLPSSASSSSSEQAPTLPVRARKARPSSSADRRPGGEAAAAGPTGSDGARAFGGLSMMERQAEWLRRKQDKVEAERLRQEEEKERELTFQPKILRRATYGEADKPTKEPTKELSKDPAAAPRPLRRGESLGHARKLEGVPTTGPKEKAIPKVPRPAGPKSRRRKAAPAPHGQPSHAGASVSQPIEIPSSLLASMKSELEASKAARRQASAAAEDGDGDGDEDSGEDDASAGDDCEDGEEAAAAAVGGEDGPVGPLKSWSERPAIGGRRVDFDAGGTKARLVLQDASRFDLTSMYRKTDRKAGRDGVALHMGRREDTFEEEVIAVLFDKEKVSELEAARWWLDHEHRFADFLRAVDVEGQS